MLRLLKNLFRRPPIRMGLVDDARIHRTRIRNAQFVSFVDASGCFETRCPDRFDRSCSSRRRMELGARR